MGTPASRARTHARLVALACAIPLAAVLPSRAGPVDAKPSVAISAPQDAHVFEPEEQLAVQGTATAARGLLAVKLEYWLLNKLERRVLADCTACGTPASSWGDHPQLKPGYYVVKAYAVDNSGAFSDAAQRSFFAALENVPKPKPPSAPSLPIPGINTPDPKKILPGASGPVGIGGTSAPGSTVKVWETEYGLGPIGSVKTGSDGKWTFSIRLPSGNFAVQVQATDGKGHVSPLSKILSFGVDADRPRVLLPTGDVLVFPPTEPVTIEGRVFDNRRVASVWVEYWLLDDLALRDRAQCPACGTQEAIWWNVPELPGPGYYYVKIHAFDSAGNPSWTSTTSFVAVG